MENIETTVAAQGTAAEASAADAQAAEVSVEEVLAQLNADANDGETVENEGADGHDAQEAAQEQPAKAGNDSGRRDNQMRAALRQQRKTIFEKDLGMPEEQVRELIRAHKATELTKTDPEISQKAAKMIVEARERAETAAQSEVYVTVAQKEDLLALQGEGWTKDELLAFARDSQAVRDVIAGTSVRDAAHAYRERMTPAKQERRKAAPIARGTSAGSTPVQNPIEAMSDEQYDAFMADLRRRAMRGEKVRI